MRMRKFFYMGPERGDEGTNFRSSRVEVKQYKQAKKLNHYVLQSTLVLPWVE